MEIVPLKKTAPISFPLPLYESICIAEATDKEIGRFFIFAGLSRELAAQLKKLSLDEGDTELQKNTSDLERFGYGSFENWYKKQRTPFCLVEKDTNSLAAIVWFGPKSPGLKSEKHENNNQATFGKDNEQKWHTISYRCYPRFRGKGLMKKFAGFVMDIYLQKLGKVKLWAGINSKNMTSGALAASLGFTRDENLSNPKANWLVMVRQ